MDGNGQLNDAEIRPEVAAGLADLLDQEGPDLGCQVVQLLRRQGLQIARALDQLNRRDSDDTAASVCGAASHPGSVEGQTVGVPGLPEVESARAAIERAALGRNIADVDDSDSWVCRPHHPGEIRGALVGRRLTAANRRGKSMACETSGAGGSRSPGPELGIHLGMSGRILIIAPDGESTEGGDYLGGRYSRAADAPNRKPVWDRFTITFDDGGSLRLFDKRRLGRVRLDPDLDRLGPDAEMITAKEFANRIGRSTAPV